MGSTGRVVRNRAVLPSALVRAIESAWPAHPDYRIDLVPCRHPCRVWAGDTVLAETASAVRVEETWHVPRLYVPLEDVRLDLLTPSTLRTVCPFKGEASYWSLDGRDMLWTYLDPFPEVAGLSGLGAFYDDQVRVELVDDGGTGAPRDVTYKRFPTWGDAADLIDVLDVRPQGPGRYRSASRPDLQRAVVEGSQLLAQALIGATKEVPGRRVASAHMVFTRPADPSQPVELVVEPLVSGRTFTTLSVGARQGERLCGPAIVLLDAGGGEVIEHHAAMPEVPGPYECPPYDMSVTGRDVRVVDGAYTPDPDELGPPAIDAWVRFAEVPDEPDLHVALLAQFTGHLSIAAALRPHAGVGEAQAHRSLSTAPMAISLSVHRDVDMTEWLLYSHRSTSAAGGMTHAECRAYRADGALVASFTVEAMVRSFTPHVDRPERATL